MWNAPGANTACCPYEVLRLLTVVMPGLLTDSSPEAVNVAGEAMLVEALAFLTGLLGGEVHRDPDMLRFVMGVPVASDNGVAGTRLRRADAEKRVEETIRFFERRSVPWSWRVASGTEPPELDQVLVVRGFRVADDVPRLAIGLDSFVTGARPVGLKIVHVRDGSSSEAWVSALNRAFGMKGAMASTIKAWAGADPRDGRWERYLGMVDGRPVSTSGVYLFGGVAGIVQVATVPDFRRRGIGEAVTAAALEHAREAGYRIAVLGTSDVARSMYERMGFREVGRMKTLIPQGIPTP